MLRGAGMVSIRWAFQKCLGAQRGIYCLEGGYQKQIPHLLEMVLLVVCSLGKIYIKIIPNESHKICEHLSEEIQMSQCGRKFI